MEAGNQMLLLLFIVLLGGIIGYQVIRSKIFEQRRGPVVDKHIVKEGWHLEPKAKVSLMNRYSGFPFFKHSKGTGVRNVIHGKVYGIRFVAFDYQYLKKVHGAYRRTPQMKTVVIVELHGIDLPTFALIEPRTLEPPLDEFEIIGNIGLYRLEGLDAQVAENFITADIVSEVPAFNVQSADSRLLFYRTWRRSEPTTVVSEIHHCITFAATLAKRAAGRLGVYEFAA